MAVMREKYDTLAADPGYQALKQTCPILATWDDHDYGRNDAGAEYPAKTESQQAFLDFFDEPADSERRGTPGVYDAKVFGPTGKRVQIILLDTRYFRSELTKAPRGPEGDGRLGSYVPNNDPDTTILGAAQWTWLSEQLRQPAEIRVIVSSIQVVAEDHRFEKWMNHPHERERLYKLIGQTKARGVLFISGDRHMAELSRMDGGVGYPLYDLTSSALNQTSDWYNEINRHRWSRAYSEPNYGLITIDWSQADPTITLEIRKVDGKPAIWHQIALSGSNRDR
jgi:alkaline phosphatase D